MKKDLDLIVSIKSHWKMIDLLFATRPKQKAILEMRIKGYKQIEIAKKMKTSKQNINQLLKLAINKCKEFFTI